MRNRSKRLQRVIERKNDKNYVWECKSLDQALNFIARARKRRRLTRVEKDILIHAENAALMRRVDCRVFERTQP